MSEFIRSSTDYFSLTNLKGNHQKFSRLKAQTMRTRGNSAKGLLRWDKLSENYKFYSMVKWVCHRQSGLSSTSLNVSLNWKWVQKFWDITASFKNNIWTSLLILCAPPTPIIRVFLVWKCRCDFKNASKAFKFSPSYLVWTGESCWVQLFPPAHPWDKMFQYSCLAQNTFHKLWGMRKGKANCILCSKIDTWVKGGTLELGNEQQRLSHAGTPWIPFLFLPPLFGRPWRAPCVSWLKTF